MIVLSSQIYELLKYSDILGEYNFLTTILNVNSINLKENCSNEIEDFSTCLLATNGLKICNAALNVK